MNRTVKTLLILALPAGSLLAAGYVGLRLWLCSAILHHWKEMAEARNQEFVSARYRKQLRELSTADLVALWQYSKKYSANAPEPELKAALAQVNKRQILKRLGADSLEGIIAAGIL